TNALCARLLASRRGVIGTRLLNLNGVDSDHPEPMVQDIWPGGTGGDLFLFDAAMSFGAGSRHRVEKAVHR
ncbi:MAG: hypothetical protein ACXW16_11700, partial [Burkholderiaceae bacterium]